MKTLSTILIITVFLGLACSSGSESDQSVLLRWKLGNGESIAYKASMDPVDPAEEVLLRIDVKAIAEGLSIPDEVKEEFLEFRQRTHASMTNILTKKPNGRISVKMIADSSAVADSPVTSEDSVLADLIKKINGTVQLRGEMDEAGKVTSFYLEKRQSDLISMWFELPEDPVKVGDTWSVDVNFVTMGHGYIVNKADRTNQVTLTALTKTEDGDLVATIEYVFSEYAEGTFQFPGSEEGISSVMSCGFYAQAKFLVNKGRWLEFKGQARVKMTGMMASDSHQHLNMTLMDTVPEDLLKLE